MILGKIYIDQLRFAEAEAELQLALSLNPIEATEFYQFPVSAYLWAAETI